jgi:hypothetical protein
MKSPVIFDLQALTFACIILIFSPPTEHVWVTLHLVFCLAHVVLSRTNF